MIARLDLNTGLTSPLAGWRIGEPGNPYSLTLRSIPSRYQRALATKVNDRDIVGIAARSFGTTR